MWVFVFNLAAQRNQVLKSSLIFKFTRLSKESANIARVRIPTEANTFFPRCVFVSSLSGDLSIR